MKKCPVCDRKIRANDLIQLWVLDLGLRGKELMCDLCGRWGWEYAIKLGRKTLA